MVALPNTNEFTFNYVGFNFNSTYTENFSNYLAGSLSNNYGHSVAYTKDNTIYVALAYDGEFFFYPIDSEDGELESGSSILHTSESNTCQSVLNIVSNSEDLLILVK